MARNARVRSVLLIIAAYSAVSRVNVCHSIALRHQLKLSHRFLQTNEMSTLEIGPEVLDIHGDLPRIVDEHFKCNNASKMVCTLEWVRQHNRKMQEGSVIMIASESGPQFYEISNLVKKPTYYLHLYITYILPIHTYILPK